MNIRHFSSSLLIAMICLSLVAGTAIAQRPARSTFEPGAVQDPTNDNQDPVIIRPPAEPAPRRAFVPPQDKDESEDQAVLVNTKYAGWEEVTETVRGERISDIIRGNWIMVDPNGRIEGSVAAAEGANVDQMNLFLMNKGRLVKQTTITSDGRFEFTNLRQGAYSLIGWGPNAFFAFGLNILAYNPQNNGVIVNNIKATAYQNKTTINTDWIQYFAPLVSFRVYGRYPFGEGRDDPADMYGFTGLYENLPQSTLATSISGRQVVKDIDGSVRGRIHQVSSLSGRPVDVQTTKVMLFQGDGVVASTTTDNYGGFAFQQVPDGSYGVTAAGVDGVGSIAIEVVTGKASVNAVGDIVTTPSTPIDFTLVSSETIGWLNHYAAEVAYNRALLAPRPPQPGEGQNLCPNCGLAGCGCNPYANCNSRSISFGQWAQSGCHCKAQKFGDGSILAAWTKQQRINIGKSNDRIDTAFYPEQDLRGLNQNQGVPNQGVPIQPNGF